MGRAIDDDEPEHMIAVLNRNRNIKVFAVVAGLVVALGTLFWATTAMYAEDPAVRALSNPGKAIEK
jgi:hypothetical protein